MRLHASALCVLSLGVLGGLAQTGTARAADPFYERLMETGILSHATSDYQNAAADLRIACFGLLDEPVTLAECLTYLALAQAELGDVPAFTHTFDRILEVERMFQAFSQVDLRAELRQSLENRVESWIPYEVLDRSPIFRDAARRKRAVEILEMPLEQRRQELDLRLAAEPDHPTWRLLSAELDLATGKYETAWTAADAVLSSAPQSQRALCVRGRAGAVLGRCEQALPDIDFCDAPEARGELLEAKLRCQILLEDWDGASVLLSEMPAGVRRKSPFRQLSRDVLQGRKLAQAALAAALEPGAVDTQALLADEAAAGDTEAPQLDEVPAIAPPTEELPAIAPPTEESPVAASVSEAGPNLEATPSEVAPDDTGDRVRAELEQIEILLQAGSRSELEGAFARARQLADQHQQLPEPQLLAAEIAYRLSSWQEAVIYFKRGGELDTQRPERQFYLAVALYEAGDRAAAKQALERCLSFLEPTDFVRSYREKILNGG